MSGNLQQQTEEWLNFRKNKIGASDAPIIMGVSPWSTPYQLWEEKIGVKKGKIVTAKMKRGIDNEEAARKRFTEKTGISVSPKVMAHPGYEWMIASLDGIDQEEKNIVEIKCAGREDHLLAMNGQIPDKYYPQLQHQMEVCGLDMAYYFSFDGKDGIYLECQRNSKYIKKMIEMEQEFFRCMQDFVAPKLTDMDYLIKNDEMWSECAKEWLENQKQLNNLEKKDKELREKLVLMCDGRNSCGEGIQVSKVVRKGNIDYSLIPHLKNVNFDSYRKEPIECWKITKKGP